MRTRVTLVLALVLALSSAYPSVTAQTGPQRSVLLDTVTSGVGQIDGSQFSDLTFYLVSVGTTSGGTVAIEEADWDPSSGTPYTGTWSSITTINASTFTGGAQLAYHVTAPTAFAFVRARISSAITGGGTVSVVLRAK